MPDGRELTINVKYGLPGDYWVERGQAPRLIVELESVEGRKVGWTLEEQTADYFLWLFDPADCKHGYLADAPSVRAAVQRQRQNWAGAYGVHRARNPGYCTLFMRIPVPVMAAALCSSVGPHTFMDLGIGPEECWEQTVKMGRAYYRVSSLPVIRSRSVRPKQRSTGQNAEQASLFKLETLPLVQLHVSSRRAARRRATGMGIRRKPKVEA